MKDKGTATLSCRRVNMWKLLCTFDFKRSAMVLVFILLLFYLSGCGGTIYEEENIAVVTLNSEKDSLLPEGSDQISEVTNELKNILETTDESEVVTDTSYTDCSICIDSLIELGELNAVIYIYPVEVDLELLDDIHKAILDLRQEYVEEVSIVQRELFGDDYSLQYEIEMIPSDQIIFYRMRYKSGDYGVIALIAAPTDYKTIKYPVLIWNRGGNGDFGKNHSDEIQYLARHGFIVLATQYRGVDGGTGIDRFGGDDVYDVLNLIDFAEMFTFTTGKIYMFGWSRGAMQTYIVLSRDDRIDAAVTGAGPTDLARLYYERDAEFQSVLRQRIGRGGGTPTAMPDEYIARSAIQWPEMIQTPLLIVHGTADERVGYSHSQELYELMSALRKDVKLVLLQDMDHYVPSGAFLTEYLLWLRDHG